MSDKCSIRLTAVVLKIMSAVLVSVGCVSIIFYLFTYFKEPLPVRAYHKHHDEIIKYVKSINEGKIAESKGRNGGYVILDTPEGLIAVRKTIDGAIHFVFESSPLDSTPVLVFCPESKFDIRKITTLGGDVIIKGECLDPNWFYYESDF